MNKGTHGRGRPREQGKKKMTKKLYYILLIIFFWGCIIGKSRMEEREYRGVIIDIYRVPINHDELIFLVKTEYEEFEMLASSWRPSSQYAAVGDSIIKVREELKITIKKPDGDARTFQFWD